MRFMILRKADADTEAGRMPSGELLAQMARFHEQLMQAGLLVGGEGLQPSSTGVRVRFVGDRSEIVHGPFDETGELIAGFSMIDAPSKEDAIAWMRRWPALDGDGEAELEIRELGCVGGLRGIDALAAPTDAAAKMRCMILLKADRDFEAGVVPSAHCLQAMAQRNEEGRRSGIVIGAEGLQPSRNGVRMKFSGGRPALIDGPFAETKELVAGFWLLAVDAIEDAIAWVQRYPYPRAGDAVFEVEIRRLFEAADFGAGFTPELHEAETRMREQLTPAAENMRS